MSKGDTDFVAPIVTAAAQVAKTAAADVLFAYVDAVPDLRGLLSNVTVPTKPILICRNPEDESRAKELDAESISVPKFDLTRMDQIKMATLIAFSQQILKAGDVFVFLTGVVGHHVDTLVVMRVGEEFELFQSVGQPNLTEHIRRPVFERVLRLALELANEGREGKPVGSIFVVGDHRSVQKHCSPGRINPFKGYNERARNVLDDSIADTIKEIAKLDGAFILKGNGVIMEGCATLRPAPASTSLSAGLGTRHAAAAAITAVTRSIAVTLSESTGDVRVWRRGSMITEIGRASHAPWDIIKPPSFKKS